MQFALKYSLQAAFCAQKCFEQAEKRSKATLAGYRQAAYNDSKQLKEYLVSLALIQYHSETAKSEVRGQQLNQPIYTIDGSPRYALFTPYLSKYFGGVVGSKINKPLPTVTAIDHNSLTMPYLTQYYGGADHANSVLNPLQTVTVKPRHFLCESYLTILRKNMDCKAIMSRYLP